MAISDQSPVIQGGTDGTEIGNVIDSLKTTDIVNSSGTEGAITVGTTAVAARVGGSNFTNRTLLTIFNNSNNDIYWGYNNTVTTSSGTPIFKNQFLSIAIGENITIYLIAGSAGNNVRITEAA